MDLSKIRDFIPYIFLFSFVVILSLLFFPIKTQAKEYYDYETQKNIPLGKEDYTSLIIIGVCGIAIMGYIFFSKKQEQFMVRSILDTVLDDKCRPTLNLLKISDPNEIIEGGELKRYTLGYLGFIRLKNEEDKEITINLDLRKNYYDFRETPIVGFTIDNITPEKALKRITPKDVQDTTSQLIDLAKNRDKLTEVERRIIDDTISKEEDEE